MSAGYNKLQIIGIKVYYDMVHVATLNELNISRQLDEFKLKLVKLHDLERLAEKGLDCDKRNNFE